MGPIVSRIKIEYLLVGIVVALTGFEFAYRASIYLQFIILFFVALYFISLKKKFNSKFFLLAVLFLIPLFFQTLQIGSLYPFIANGTGQLVKFLICYLILEIVKERFHITFVGFIYFLAIFSFIFFPTQFFPSIEETIKNSIGSLIKPLGSETMPDGFTGKTLIFFNYIAGFNIAKGDRMLRNCGPFWEPGMFAIFLNIALLINIYINKSSLFSKKNVVFIIAIITTVSTTGFIALFIIFLSKYFLIKEKYKFFLFAPVLFAFAYVTYTYVWTLESFSKKIEVNFNNRQEDRRSRFGAALYHFDKLQENPLSGVVFIIAEREKNIRYEDRLVSPNGLSYVFFVWGMPIGILYYILFYRGIRKWLLQNNIKSKSVFYLFFFIFLLLAFSQDITVRNFYLMFVFFTICSYKSPKINKIYNSYNYQNYGAI